jgi:hypothetical protein
MAGPGLPAAGRSVQDVGAKRLGGGSFRELQPAIKGATHSGFDQILENPDCDALPCDAVRHLAKPAHGRRRRLLAGVRQVNGWPRWSTGWFLS